jgi:predicted  nucleic acid-binding Zn-ribbon protein
METIQILNAIPAIGATGVLFLMALWSRDGTLRWGKAVDAEVKALNERIAALEKALTDARADKAAEMAALRADKDRELGRQKEWSDSIWQSLLEALATIRENATTSRHAVALTETLVAVPRPGATS